MGATTGQIIDAAERLHQYMIRSHWTGDCVSGPDVGVRFNSRIGRFIKGYLNFIPWSDNYTYIQGQAYWILSNWLLKDLFGKDRFAKVARNGSNFVLSRQHPDGYWIYPNPEWKGRIATVEGCFGAISLLESYKHLQYKPFLVGAQNWYDYLHHEVGFQENENTAAVNYFSNCWRQKVPNNTTLLLWTLAKFVEVTGDHQYLAKSPKMVTWLKKMQLPNGELPYSVKGLEGGQGRPHFLCFQYNSFEFLDLVEYYQITGDRSIWPILENLIEFLSNGLTRTGSAKYDCFQVTPEVIYYTAAIAQALSQGTILGIKDCSSLAGRAFERVLNLQKKDGSVKFFSQKNYRLLSDRRSYPRSLSMILFHLLSEVKNRAGDQLNLRQKLVRTNRAAI